MSGNRYLIPDRTTLLKTKLDVLSKHLQTSVKNGSFETQEEYLTEATNIVSAFYKDLLSPILEEVAVLQDCMPNPEVYNTIWNAILDDLIVVFTELENMETLTLANFNYITTESNRLISRLKAVSSKLGDYILYSTDRAKEAMYFTDSFNDLSKIDILSGLLNADQCSISQEQGIITLPIDIAKVSTLSVKEAPVINPNSNGFIGNNQEIGKSYRGDISAILDNNPDTWFEYERVITRDADTKEPLILDFVINLGEPAVLNYIRINPNNFGTKTIIKIEAIDTSLDGKLYTSIKDDIPIPGYLTKDEENIFVLAPATSKYSGQGIYSFTPRNVKYIHIVLKQTESYLIETPSGQRLRYAIGLRDVDLRGVAYKNAGEFVSTPFSFTSPVKKVLLETNQNPSQLSELAAIEYQISPDDGLTWFPIQPKEIASQSGKLDVPEVLNFNSLDANSVSTAAPVYSLRVKGIFKRNDNFFTADSSSLSKQIVTKSEVHTLPTESPFTIDLMEAPIIGSVLLVDTMYGSRGIPGSPYIVGYPRELSQQKYRLPFKTFPRPFKKVLLSNRYQTEPMTAGEWLVVEVGGERWEHITQPMDEYASTDKVYKLNVNDGTLEFGNDTHGKTPAANQLITIYLERERLFPSETEDSHKAKLEFTTTANKEDITIKRFDSVSTEAEILPRRSSIIKLKHPYLVDTTDIESVINNLPGTSTKVDYQNGKDELTSTDKWSMDTENGLIYLATPTPDNIAKALSYTYQPIYILDSTEWEWGNSDIIRDSVSIKETAWSTISADNEPIYYTTNSKVFELANISVTKGSLTFSVNSGIADTTSGFHPFVKEVGFIDGSIELGSPVINVIDKIIFDEGELVGDIQSYILQESVITDTDYALFFTNKTLFNTEVETTPDNPGEYFVDRVNNTIAVNIDGLDTSAPGRVSYFTQNANYLDNGLYSVDYTRGKIYTQRPVSTDVTSITASYTYSDYRAEYRISRIVDTKNYEVDIIGKQIVLKDSEVLNRPLIPHNRIDSHEPFYVVNYDYVVQTKENIQGLRDFFSPVLKDYVLKAITKGKLP